MMAEDFDNKNVVIVALTIGLVVLLSGIVGLLRNLAT